MITCITRNILAKFANVFYRQSFLLYDTFVSVVPHMCTNYVVVFAIATIKVYLLQMRFSIHFFPCRTGWHYMIEDLLESIWLAATIEGSDTLKNRVRDFEIN